MKNKFISLGLLMCLLSIAIVAATTTLNTPVADSNHTGTVVLNCTTDIINATSVTFYRSAATGGDATTSMVTVTNTTLDQLEFTNTYTISSLTDGSSYNITCYAVNNSAISNETSAAAGGITFDSTAPTITLTLNKNIVEYMTSISITSSCSDSVDSSPTTTRVLNKGGDTGDQVSFSSSPYTLTGGDLNVIGQNSINVSCEDYTGNQDSSISTFTIDTDESGFFATDDDDDTSTTSLNVILLWVLLICAFLVIILAVWYMSTKK